MHSQQAPTATGDERFMAMAIALAKKAEGQTHPNPLVGALLVRGETILGRGFHARAGEDHAEVAALKDARGPVEGATLYVNHEPCCHFGRTPPCTQAIIKAKIARVVIGTIDPDPRVSGGGIKQLQDAGIEVTCGVLEEESRALNAPFFKYISQGLPWVSAKWAMSLDGKIATHTGHSQWITGPVARKRAHRLRHTHDAILIGKSTLLNDDPRLTCRIEGGRDPVRFVIDARLEAPPTQKIFNLQDSPAPTIVFTAEDADPERRQALEDRGVQLVSLPRDERGWLDSTELLKYIAARELMSVLVEGGGALLGDLFDHNHLDYAYAFIASRIIGGARAPSPVEGQGITNMAQCFDIAKPIVENLGDDILVHGPLHRAHPSLK